MIENLGVVEGDLRDDDASDRGGQREGKRTWVSHLSVWPRVATEDICENWSVELVSLLLRGGRGDSTCITICGLPFSFFLPF